MYKKEIKEKTEKHQIITDFSEQIKDLKIRIASLIRSFMQAHGEDAGNNMKVASFANFQVTGYEFSKFNVFLCSKVFYLPNLPESMDIRIPLEDYYQDDEYEIEGDVENSASILDFDADISMQILSSIEKACEFRKNEFETLEKNFADLYKMIAQNLSSVVAECDGTMTFRPFNPYKAINGLRSSNVWIHGVNAENANDCAPKIIYSIGYNTNLEISNFNDAEIITLDILSNILSLAAKNIEKFMKKVKENDTDELDNEYEKASNLMEEAKMRLTSIIRNLVLIEKGRITIDNSSISDDEIGEGKILVNEIMADDNDFTKEIKISGTIAATKEHVEIPMDKLPVEDISSLAEDLIRFRRVYS